jgi:peptide/nickel transport system substrate-binding protein
MSKSTQTPRIVALVGLVGCLVLASCSSGSGAGSSTSTSAGKPQSGGSITLGLADVAGNLDPGVTALDEAGTVDRQIFDSLVYEAPDHSFKPWLATSWTISPDGKTYTFTLRKDVKFQDGTPFNAAAVKYTLDRVVDPKTGSQLANQLIAQYASSDVVNANTVKVNLKQAYAPLLSSLSEPFLGIVSPTAAAKEGLKGFGAHPVGTGPFAFDHSSGQNEVVLTRNAAYKWPPAGSSNTGAAYLSKITFRSVPEASSRVAALESGQLDLAEVIPPVNVSAIKSRGLAIDTSTFPGVPYWLAFNEQHAPWNEEQAREAVRDGLNIDAIVKALFFGQYQRAWGPLTPATPSYDPKVVNSFSYNPTKAGQLLDSLGWKMNSDSGYREKDGKTLTLNYLGQSNNVESRLDVANLMATQLQTIGVKVNVVSMTFGDILGAVQKGNYDLAGVDDVQADPSALDLFFGSDQQPTPKVFGVNWAHLDNSQVDGWLQQGDTSSDQATRDSAYAKVQEYVNAQVVGIPVDVPTSIIGMSKKVHGLEHDPSTDYVDLHNTWVS